MQTWVKWLIVVCFLLLIMLIIIEGYAFFANIGNKVLYFFLTLPSETSPLFTAIAAAGTTVAASAAWWAVRTTKRIHEASLYTQYMQQYASKEMASKLRTLRDWAEQFGEDFVKQFEKAIFDKASPNFSDAYEVDIARRYVKNFYLSALQLRENRYVKTKFIKNVTEYDGIYILYDYVQPLEPVLNPDYDETKFKKLKKIHPDRRTPEDKAKVRQIPALQQHSHSKEISESLKDICLAIKKQRE